MTDRPRACAAALWRSLPAWLASAGALIALLTIIGCSGMRETPRPHERDSSVDSRSTTLTSMTDASASASAARTDDSTGAAPANTWIAFEEIVPVPGLERVRVPQSDDDIKGPLFWTPRYAYDGLYGYEISDLCNIRDVPLAARFLLHLDREPTGRQVLWLQSLVDQADCGDADEIGDGRWLLIEDGPFPEVVGVYRSYDGARSVIVGEEPDDQLRLGRVVLGFFSYVDQVPLETGIRFGADDSVADEVRVLQETVSVSDGVLRGLVRNWSRTRWAYAMTVHVGDQEYRWPLSIQPGELAPFEIEISDGPDETVDLEITIEAEMSNDADWSRAWGAWPTWEYYILDHPGWLHPPQEALTALPPNKTSFRHLGAVRQTPVSHPSLHGELADGVGFDLLALAAHLDADGGVADVESIVPFSDGLDLMAPADGKLPPGAEWSPYDDNRVNYPPFVVRRYPMGEFGVNSIDLVFDDTVSEGGFLLWIGGDARS